MFYVVMMDNPAAPDGAGMPTRVRLVGPFPTAQDCAEWARDVANNPHDNRRWQVVDLAAPTVQLVRTDAVGPPPGS